MRALSEIWDGEVLVVKLGRSTYKLSHLPAHKQLAFLKNISSAFYFLNLITKQEERVIPIPLNKKTQKEIKQELADFVKRSTTNSSYDFFLAYENCIHHTWALIKSTVPFYKRFFLKKVFYKKCRKKVVWFLGFLKEVYDFWLFLGKQIRLVMGMASETMTTGRGYRTPYKKEGIVVKI